MVLNSFQFGVHFRQECPHSSVVIHDVEVVPWHADAKHLEFDRETVVKGNEVAPGCTSEPEGMQHLPAILVRQDAGLQVFQVRRRQWALQFNDAFPVVHVAVR